MRLIQILLPTMLLAACSQPAPPADKTAAPTTSPPATAPTAAEDAPQAGLSPDAVEPSTTPTPDTAPPVAGTDSAATPAAPSEGGARERIDSLLGNADKYESVFNDLQRGIAAGDRAAVAGLMRYPVRVSIAGKSQQVKDAASFQRDYDKIVTPSLTKLIGEQKFDELFVNWQGVMLGQGEVWINGVCPDNDCKNADVKVNNIGE
ncbi:MULTISPECIES: hypothetical protein [Stenotrophomonas]|uniref:hypothetical protein n=1 Tax=Stenotrophomonas TaxID=40323 RepID=UPI0008720395|nr:MULTISPECIES: hypothetical protein [Stenotrophomonas]OEZ00035.1 hypothetical protein BIY45_13760 [Stenotrophomonas sp. BIIR7]